MLIKPLLGDVKLKTIPATTTAEMKYGKNVMVCVALLIPRLVICVTTKAKIIEAGKIKPNCHRANITVFFTVLAKSGLEKYL